METARPGGFSQRRLAFGARLLLALFFPFWLYWFALFLGLVADKNAPNVDFIVYWTAAEIAAAGDAAVAYDPDAFEAKQMDAVGDDAEGFPWIYPPVAFVLVLPLALLSYGAAFGAWLLATGAVLFAALRRLSESRATLWLALAFPATLFNLLIGQAGLLTAGIFAWTMLLLPSRPVAAGALFGVMAFKPHFMPLVLLALLAGREFKAFAATLASATGLILVSAVAFGPGAWREFVRQIPDSTALVYDGVLPVEKMQSITSLALSLGASDLTSQVLQAVTAVAAAAFVVWLWRGNAAFEYKAAGLGLAGLLFTPYVYHYDMTVMGVAMLFFARRASASGWLPWERLMLALAWFAPAVCIALSLTVAFPIGAPIIAALAAFVVRRVRFETAAMRLQRYALPAAA